MTTDTEVPSAEELVARHLAFKENAVEVAHKYAAGEGHCRTFDAILHDIGLPGRDGFYTPGCDEGCCPPDQVRPTLIGEPTEAEFNFWRCATAKKLYDLAQRHGIYSADSAMREAGFPTREELEQMTKTVNVKIDGSFVLYTSVEAIEGVDLIEFIDPAKILRQVRNEFNTDSVTWKATVADC